MKRNAAPVEIPENYLDLTDEEQDAVIHQVSEALLKELFPNGPPA